MPLISLDQLTVGGESPTELVDIAADAGYDAISPVVGGDPAFPAHGLAVGDAETKAMNERLAARGVSVNNLDGLTLTADPDWDVYAGMIELGLYIGARRGVVFLYDPDAARAQGNLFHLAEMASAAGLDLALEFSAMAPVGSLAHAVDYIRDAPAPIGVVVDLMHLSYAGETPADIAGLQPDDLQAPPGLGFQHGRRKRRGARIGQLAMSASRPMQRPVTASDVPANRHGCEREIQAHPVAAGRVGIMAHIRHAGEPLLIEDPHFHPGEV